MDWFLKNTVTLQEIPLGVGENTVGRQVGSRIHCPSVYSSRNHCVIIVEENKEECIKVKDLNSSNGTFLNEQLIIPLRRTELQDGDTLGIGTNREQEGDIYIFKVCKRERKPVVLKDKSLDNSSKPCDATQATTSEAIAPSVPVRTSEEEAGPSEQRSTVKAIKEEGNFLSNRKRKEPENGDVSAPKIKKIDVKSEPLPSDGPSVSTNELRPLDASNASKHQSESENPKEVYVFEGDREKLFQLAQEQGWVEFKPARRSTSDPINQQNESASSLNSTVGKPSLDSTKRLSHDMDADLDTNHCQGNTSVPENEDSNRSRGISNASEVVSPENRNGYMSTETPNNIRTIPSLKESDDLLNASKQQIVILKSDSASVSRNLVQTNGSVDIETISLSDESETESTDTVAPPSGLDAVAKFNNIQDIGDDEYPFDDDFEEEEEDSKNWFSQLSQTSQLHMLDVEEAEDRTNPPEPPPDVYTTTNDDSEDIIRPVGCKPTVLSMLNDFDSDAEFSHRAPVAKRTSRSVSSSGDSDSIRPEQPIAEVIANEEPLLTAPIVISSDSNDSDLFQRATEESRKYTESEPKDSNKLDVPKEISTKEIVKDKPLEREEKDCKPDKKPRGSRKAELISPYPLPQRKSHQRGISAENAEKLYSEQKSKQQMLNRKSDVREFDKTRTSEAKVPYQSSKGSKVDESWVSDREKNDIRKEKLRAIEEKKRLNKPQKDVPKPCASVKIKCTNKTRGSFLLDTEALTSSKPSKAASTGASAPAAVGSSRGPLMEHTVSKTSDSATLIRSGPRQRISRVKSNTDRQLEFAKASENAIAPTSRSLSIEPNLAPLESASVPSTSTLVSPDRSRQTNKMKKIPKKPKKTVTFESDLKLAQVKEFECPEGFKRRCWETEKKPKDVELKLREQFESEDVVRQEVLTWRPSWLHEQKTVENDDPPPIARQVRRVKENFNNAREYYQTLKPLLHHEVWASVSQAYERHFSHGPVDRSFSPGKRCSFHFMIESCAVKEVPSAPREYLQITCNVILFEEDLRSNCWPRKDDLVIIRLNFAETDPNKKAPASYFGIVSFDRKLKLYQNLSYSFDPLFKSKQSKPCSLLALKVLVVYNNFLKDKKICTTSPLEMKKVKSLIPEIRLYDALRSLPSYSLCNAILSPHLHDFSIPDSNDGLMVPLSKKLFELNSSQMKAVDYAVKMCLSPKPNICLIQGAPGTGKSLVITCIINQLLRLNQLNNESKDFTILVCASSNAAVDELVVKLGEVRQRLTGPDKFELVRAGNPDFICPKGAQFSLRELKKKQSSKEIPITDHLDYLNTEIRTLEAKRNSVKQSIESLKYRISNWGPKSKSEGNIMAIKGYEEKHKQEISKLKSIEEDIQHVKNLRYHNNPGEASKSRLPTDDMETQILKNAQVVAVTLSSCTSSHMKAVFLPQNYLQSSFKSQISVCIIDEATQCTEPESLIPLLLGVKSLILVGDPNQLSPTILSSTALKYGYGQSMFSRLFQSFTADSTKNYPLFFLDTQYRMHLEICRWPNQFFYQGKLITHQKANRKSNMSPLLPYVILSTSCKASHEGEINEQEADMVVNLILEILKRPECRSMSIGVITPYQKQKKYFQTRFVDVGNIPKEVEVNTIDSYQGSEKDIIILSTVRTNGVGFLENQQRLNVSLTRAKCSLFICGNFISLQEDATWKALIDDAKSRGVYKRVFTNKEGKYLSYVLKSGKN